MALPGNDHYAHSDGYYSDKGEPDTERMMVEVADDLEQIDGVESVRIEEDIDGPYVEVEYDSSAVVRDEIEDVAVDWDCRVPTEGDDWCDIRRT